VRAAFPNTKTGLGAVSLLQAGTLTEIGHIKLKDLRPEQHLQRLYNEKLRRGLRCGELLALKRDAVFTIPDNVLAELKRHKTRQLEEKIKVGEAYRDNGLVFCTEIGTPLIPRNFERKYKALLKKPDLAGIKLHLLRYTYATRLLELGENLKVV